MAENKRKQKVIKAKLRLAASQEYRRKGDLALCGFRKWELEVAVTITLRRGLEDGLAWMAHRRQNWRRGRQRKFSADRVRWKTIVKNQLGLLNAAARSRICNHEPHFTNWTDNKAQRYLAEVECKKTILKANSVAIALPSDDVAVGLQELYTEEDAVQDTGKALQFELKSTTATKSWLRRYRRRWGIRIGRFGLREPMEEGDLQLKARLGWVVGSAETALS